MSFGFVADRPRPGARAARREIFHEHVFVRSVRSVCSRYRGLNAEFRYSLILVRSENRNIYYSVACIDNRTGGNDDDERHFYRIVQPDQPPAAESGCKTYLLLVDASTKTNSLDTGENAPIGPNSLIYLGA